MLSWEKPLVKPMAPGTISYYIASFYYRTSFTILQSLLFNLYNKNTKNIYFIISIRSHFCEWPWRVWQPLLSRWLQGSWLFVKVLGDLCVVSYWIDTLVLKTEGNTYATLLHHPFLFKGKPMHAQEVARRISRAVAGEIYAKSSIPSTHHKILSLALHYLPLPYRFPLPHF